MQGQSAHILVVEDDEVLTVLIQKGLQKSGYQVSGTSDLKESLRLIRQNQFNLILLDINLPDGSGTQLLAEMRRAQNETPIIVLSFLNDVATKVLHLEVGADDFITKPFAFEELLARIAVQLRRFEKDKMRYDGSPTEGDILEVDELKIDFKNQRITLDNHLIHFTPKEFDILAYLARHQDQVCSRQDLWQAMGEKGDINKTSTLNVHVMHVRKKIAERFEINCIKKRGFIFSRKK